MFFGPERILAMREMIFSESMQEREKALQKLLPFQKEDFVGIFEAMDGRPVNIRLLDPPLHEFLPKGEKEKEDLAKVLGIEVQEVEEKSKKLHEFNPMLGHRGCRLGVTYPEIYRMQARAIAEAMLLADERGTPVEVEIMIPLIFIKTELKFLKEQINQEIDQVFSEVGKRIKYKVGTMIEFPRAALTAEEIAPMADFFSFGTNDLTQTTFGLSRDDAGKFLPAYISHHQLIDKDPFISIDQAGVGKLVEYACKSGKSKNPNLHLGICGEHGGDPTSIDFFQRVGLDYISCSPYRVPVARLAAAQSAIKYGAK